MTNLLNINFGGEDELTVTAYPAGEHPPGEPYRATLAIGAGGGQDCWGLVTMEREHVALLSATLLTWLEATPRHLP